MSLALLRGTLSAPSVAAFVLAMAFSLAFMLRKAISGPHVASRGFFLVGVGLLLFALIPGIRGAIFYFSGTLVQAAFALILYGTVVAGPFFAVSKGFHAYAMAKERMRQRAQAAATAPVPEPSA